MRSSLQATEGGSVQFRRNEMESEIDSEKHMIVDWDGPGDPSHPQNLSKAKKWFITLTYGLMTFVVTFASSVFSTANQATSIEFHVSTEVMTLATALTVLGFAFGPLLFGPLSELYGRKWPLLSGFLVFAIFNIPVAVAENLQTIMICRFFVGFGGAAPLAIVGGGLADIFDPVTRGAAVLIFAGATFMGSIAGPIVGGFVTQSYLGWRWTQWLTLIPALVLLLVGVFFVPETYSPVLLTRRARNLRLDTGNWALHSRNEAQRADIGDIARTYLIRPIAMLVREPILLLVTIYMSLIYGILYLFFEAFPVSFNEEREWNLGVGALPFLSIAIGIILGSIVILFHIRLRYASIVQSHGSVPPEERLLPMMLGSILLPAGLFWWAWTSNPNIIWVPQVIAGVPIGMGLVMIFLQGLNYIIDVYTKNANSAVAANVFLRSWVGAGFTMFATGMFHNLGVPWATSLLAFLCTALVPVPFLFWIYGAAIRRRSKFVPT